MVDEELVRVAKGAGGVSKRFRWWWAAVVVLAAVAVMIKLQPTSGGVVWESDYQKGLELARQTNKPVLLAFHALGCVFCEKMKRTTYGNSRVIKLVDESFIPVLLSANKEVDLAGRFVELGFPSYTVLNPDGSAVETFEGYFTAKEYQKRLTGALEGVNKAASPGKPAGQR